MSVTRENAAKWIVDLRDRYSKQAEKYEAQGALIPMDALYPYIQALDLALIALRPVRREQVEKVWPGCPYCKEDGEGYVQKFGAYSIQNGELATGHCKSQKIKFCPHCSRPLTDEAVEMVMERLNKLEETKK